MFDCVDFKPEHLEQIAMRQFEADRLNRQQLIHISRKGAVQTFMKDGVIVFIAGVYHIFNRVVEVFFIPSIHVCRYPITVIRELKRFISFLEQSPVHRVQSLAIATYDSDKWMAALGFTCEGTLAKYTDDGLSFRQWARVKQ